MQTARVRLDEAARDETFDVPTRIRALTSLGRLPDASTILQEWATGTEGVMAEAALEALSYSPQSLRLLLDQANGPASSVAVAALARCAASAQPFLLGHELQTVLTAPNAKVTARKQAARLLERHRPPNALGILLEVWRDPDLHRDVRVATAVALRHFPEDPRALEALAEAPAEHASEEMLRSLFQANPTEYPLHARPAMAELIRACLTAADLPGVRFRGRKAFAAWARWYPGDHTEALAAASDPDDPSGDAQAQVLATLVEVGVVRDEILDVLARLAPENLTRPRVRALANALQSLARRFHDEDWIEPLLRDAVAILADHPLHTGTAAGLYIQLIDARRKSDADISTDLVALADLLRDRPVLADDKYGHLVIGGYYSGGAVSRDLLPTVHALIDRAHTSSQLLALRLVARGGADADWSAEWRAALSRLRSSPLPEIAEPAWNITPDA